MTNYIEFIHDQSDASIGQTFTNISDAARLVKFELVTYNLFADPGWYTYYRYTDNTKTELIENGKLYLNSMYVMHYIIHCLINYQRVYKCYLWSHRATR